MIDAEEVARLMPAYLPRQRWYGAGEREVVEVDTAGFEVLRDDWPGLVWALVDVKLAGTDGRVPDEHIRYQVFVGLRPIDHYETFLDGKGRFLLGDVGTRRGAALAYDAFVDPDLALLVLHTIDPELQATTMRPLAVEQSNTSVVFDDRLILKAFRRINPGPNPDVEVTEALTRTGFHHTPPTIAVWRREGADLAVVREFLVGSTDGFHLAQTSLRDLYDSRLPPSQSGGDFAPEARRLGEMTASLHVALARAFGTTPGDAQEWADGLDAEAQRTVIPDVPTARLLAVYDDLRSLHDAGAASRIHGDYHLGQTMRTDSGWYVLDFEGEPGRPAPERRWPGSPLRDVAAMLRSFQYAAQSVLVERGEEVDDELRDLAREWELRARGAFVEGYAGHAEVAPLLPSLDADRWRLLRAFEVGKAAYETRYELDHRPEWVDIPLGALHRLLDAQAPA